MSAAYMLYLYWRVIFGELVKPTLQTIKDLSLREVAQRVRALQPAESVFAPVRIVGREHNEALFGQPRGEPPVVPE